MNQIEMNVHQSGFNVSGDIHFNNVMSLRQQGSQLIDRILSPEIDIDLSQVSTSDHSGLSLLLRWLDYANKKQKKIHYVSIPSFLLKIAHICGIESLIKE